MMTACMIFGKASLKHMDVEVTPAFMTGRGEAQHPLCSWGRERGRLLDAVPVTVE